jgi:hypothetical protein
MRNLTRLPIAIGAVIFLIGGSVHHALAWNAEDANKKWTLPVVEGWYGGSYYQIKEAMLSEESRDKTDRNALLVKILRLLSDEARGFDAILMHLEMSADDIHGDRSLLKINTSPVHDSEPGSGFPPITALTDETWAKYGERVLGSTRGATAVQLIRHQEDIVIGGYKTATVGFMITKGQGDKRYQGIIIIYRGPTVTTFLLDAPWHVAGVRLEEMWTMARAIRFQE